MNTRNTSAILAIVAFRLLSAVGLPCAIVEQRATAAEPTSAVAVQLLEQAVRKASARPAQYREYSLLGVAEAAGRTSPAGAISVVRSIAASVKKDPLPTDRDNLHAGLAAIVAPHDRSLRDELLRSAIDEGRRAAKDETLWKADDGKGWRQLLLFEIELWENVLRAEAAPEDARASLSRLLKAARSAGRPPGDVDAPYDERLLESLAWLEPELVVAIWPANRTDEELGRFCYHQAYRRHLEGLQDRITAFLARSGVEHGFLGQEALALLVQYDRNAGIAAARRLQDRPELLGKGPRYGTYEEVMLRFTRQLAAKRPDLVAAIADRDVRGDVQRQMREIVGRVRGIPWHAS